MKKAKPLFLPSRNSTKTKSLLPPIFKQQKRFLRSFDEWWKEISLRSQENYRKKKQLIDEKDKLAAESVNTFLKPFEMNNEATILSPQVYNNNLTVFPLSLKKGNTVPYDKYDCAIGNLKSNREISTIQTNSILIFEAVSGVGKSHFANIVTQELNKYCFMIGPTSSSFKNWEMVLSEISSANRTKLKNATNTFIQSHCALLVMLLEEKSLNVNPRDFLIFQTNGGNDIVNEIYYKVCEINSFKPPLHQKVDKLNLEMVFCIDEAQVAASIHKGEVERVKSIATQKKGSALTVLASVCRSYGPTFLTTTLTGLFSEIEASISPQGRNPAIIIPIKIIWPSEVLELLNQGITFKLDGIVPLFVLNNLMGVARVSEIFINLLINEIRAVNRKIERKELLLRTLHSVLNFSLVRAESTKANLCDRFLQLKSISSPWEKLLDELLLFGVIELRLSSSFEFTELVKSLVSFGICFDTFSNETAVFLTNTHDRHFVIQGAKKLGRNWLVRIWKYMHKNNINPVRIGELLMNYLLVECFHDCISPVLKDHPLFKHYELPAIYWWHDFPLSKELKDKNYICSSSFIIKAIASHLLIKTENLKEWTRDNGRWCCDLEINQSDAFPLYPDLTKDGLSLLHYVFNPNKDAGPDAITTLVRKDWLQVLKDKSGTPEVQWINDEAVDLPPYLPLVATCTMVNETSSNFEELLRQFNSDLLRTDISHMYPIETNVRVVEEKKFIANDLSKLRKCRKLRLLCYPSLGKGFSKELIAKQSVLKNITIISDNLFETEGGDLVVVFSLSLETFNCAFSKKEIIEMCKMAQQKKENN
ncbi:hypothetical protein ABK040_005852 [Willaertia magna]